MRLVWCRPSSGARECSKPLGFRVWLQGFGYEGLGLGQGFRFRVRIPGPGVRFKVCV